MLLNTAYETLKLPLRKHHVIVDQFILNSGDVVLIIADSNTDLYVDFITPGKSRKLM